MIDIQQWLFESIVQPTLLFLHLGTYIEDAYGAVELFEWGCLEITLIALVLVPLQHWRPVEKTTNHATVRVDIIYTLLNRLGIIRLVIFLSLGPLLSDLFGVLRGFDVPSLGFNGFGTFQLDQIWPNVTDDPIASLVIYLITFDFVGYWIHRAQHRSNAWWALHSLHHAQQQMTCWSDNRNHLIDDVVLNVLMVCTGFLIGVSPSQFILIGVVTDLSQSLQHANLRLSFGRLGERLWVSPRFHRLHHSVEHGFEHNFGVLVPWWDILFGTANFDDRYGATGVKDQVEKNMDYGHGFWAQQWLGLKRFKAAWI